LPRRANHELTPSPPRDTINYTARPSRKRADVGPLSYPLSFGHERSQKGVLAVEILIKSKNLQVTDSLRSYAEKKVGKVARILPSASEARIDLGVHNARSAQNRQVAQITIRDGSGFFLRAEERSSDIRSSLDKAVARIERQVKRYKGKHWNSRGRAAEAPTPEPEEAEVDNTVVRTKTFRAQPMAVEEAIEQMELLGHDFFIFFSDANRSFEVVYRRRDGGYGLLQPELG